MVFQVNESNTLSIITRFVSKQCERVQCLGYAKLNGFSGYFTLTLSLTLSISPKQHAEKLLPDATMR